MPKWIWTKCHAQREREGKGKMQDQNQPLDFKGIQQYNFEKEKLGDGDFTRNCLTYLWENNTQYWIIMHAVTTKIIKRYLKYRYYLMLHDLSVIIQFCQCYYLGKSFWFWGGKLQVNIEN